MKKFFYHINLSERGMFFADVRNEVGETVFTIKTGDYPEDEICDPFEDGYMANEKDLPGLRNYLKAAGIMTGSDVLVFG